MVVARTIAAMSQWYFKFSLVVTGEGEKQFLAKFFRTLASSGLCGFEVIERIGQLGPILSAGRRLKVVGTQAMIPSEDQKFGLRIRRHLVSHPNAFVLIVDDLEHDRREQREAVYDRYRAILDNLLPEPDRTRASVHFLVNMLEAYYFAHPEAVTEALDLTSPFSPCSGDVEEIRNPKSELRQLLSRDHGLGFHEIKDGERIVSKLDLDIVLGNPHTCASLRTLVAWCDEKVEDHPNYATLNWKERFHLESGALFSPTRKQLRRRSE